MLVRTASDCKSRLVVSVDVESDTATPGIAALMITEERLNCQLDYSVYLQVYPKPAVLRVSAQIRRYQDVRIEIVCRQLIDPQGMMRRALTFQDGLVSVLSLGASTARSFPSEGRER